METKLFYLIIAGAVVVLFGYFWLVGIAFRTRKLWGVGVLLGVPMLFFIPLHFRRAWKSCFTMAIGGGLIGSAYAINFLWIDLGPRERMVEDAVHGQARHITLTGWDQQDYSILTRKSDTVVLQMANADVTDATLDYLKDMRLLRELDLNDTQVTDAGLPTLAALPALESLRLRGAKITDAGFKQHLFDREWLTELDVTGTDVASATLRAWKKQKEGRKYLK